MEAMYIKPQEQYIWAMRTGLYQETDSEIWKARRGVVKSEDSRLLDNVKEKGKTGPRSDELKTKTLASLVPDEIIYNVNNYSHRHYEACLLFGDVSGFTDLCEKYNRTGKSGPSRMTQVLNSYIGSMVQEVMSHNGDVLKFSGDAFLAMWKCTENDPMRDAVHMALDCALVIQKSHGMYETDVGVVIRVKLAISAGHVIFSLIGDARNSHYVVVGQPIWDVKAAESKSVAGEIIVSPTAWHNINPTEYLFEEMSDKLHVKVHGVGTNWRNVQKSTKYDNGKDDQSSSEDVQDDTADRKNAITDEFSVRPAVNVAARWKLKEDLRKFIIPPVMRGIDLDEPLEYLTEMRQVVIVFINVVSNRIETSETVNLADKTYKAVCSVVDEMKGCVNKVSLFDKDMMFVVIFGLRGFKHDLESQVALKCASECHAQISSFEEVKSASIGVTTGITYCGVFGHTLRREYTVISLIVNKAARLMVAYPYKVTCDRETFLQSKMEFRNFILQPFKELKGIMSPGPIYQFIEVATSAGITPSVNHYPLLGRDGYLDLYIKILKELMHISKEKKMTMKKLNHHSVLVIFGEARQGKTRLLDEMVYITRKTLPVNRFSVQIKDYKVSYSTIRKLFTLPLGLTESSTVKEWEDALSKTLHKPMLKAKELFCCLNKVFGVEYDRTPLYLSISDRQVKLIEKKFIMQLCHRCFPTNWVVAIDDAEFIDEESWNLLETVIEFDTVFILLSIGQTKILSSLANSILEHRKVRTFTIEPVDKWFHAGIACQFLNVYAIPVELEKVIQIQSNGNPGWIESFLVSLSQAGGITIKNVYIKKINELGLVAPPLYMLFRLTDKQFTEWKRIVEQSAGSHVDAWKMYINSYREESNTDIFNHDHRMIPVCYITPNFNMGDISQDDSTETDIVILKTFDSLTYYEQHLLKSSSILGDCFLRSMLLYIMSCDSERKAALAVEKLFEIRVLSCARGDFRNEGSKMIFKERLMHPDHDVNIKCGCIGLEIDVDCEDLPKYASCGYLRFRSSQFRETTVSLLTENQKKEFHSRAVRYLQKETRRCQACGYGFFPYFLGARLAGDLQKVRRKKSRQLREDRSLSTIKQTKSPMKKESMMISGGFGIPLHQEVKDEHVPFTDVPFFGFTIIRQLKDSYSLTKTFSAVDFSECECMQILQTVYSQLIHHCKGSGDITQMLNAMMEYSQLCIISQNIAHAKKILIDALDTFNNRQKDAEEPEWQTAMTKGRINTLLGYSSAKLGQYDLCLKYFLEAMECFGSPFPQSSINLKFLLFGKLAKHKISMYIGNELVGDVQEKYEADFSNHVCDCLMYLCKYFRKNNMWKQADLAAAWSLEMSLKSGTDFRGICNSFSNIIITSQHFNKGRFVIALEVHSLRICHRKRKNLLLEEITAAARLYYTIMYCRFSRSELDKARLMQYIILKLCATTRAYKLALKLIPITTYSLLYNKNITDAVRTVLEIEFYGQEDKDASGITWYYALCVGVMLESGYVVLPFKKCANFVWEIGEVSATHRDPQSQRRYDTVIWLWNVRIENWAEASIWFPKAIKYKDISPTASINNLITALYLLEGLILYLVYKMDARHIKDVRFAHDTIVDLLKSLTNAAKQSKFILPRLYHLQAYFRYCKYYDKTAAIVLKNAKKFAASSGNRLDQAWIDQSSTEWKITQDKKNLQTDTATVQKTTNQVDKLMDYQEFEMNGGKLSLFKLRTPKFI